jgi:peptide/nickel transport system substrate-binding protein
MFTTGYAAGSSFNDTNWNHPRFNELLRMARSEGDESKRAEMYGEMQQIVSDEGGQVIPLFTNLNAAVAAKIGFGQISGLYQLDGYKAIERWWFV